MLKKVVPYNGHLLGYLNTGHEGVIREPADQHNEL